MDDQIGNFLEQLDKSGALENTVIVFVSDHGESLGEHDYWGHGRNLKEPNLRIPMGFVYEGRVAPAVESAPALITDIAPTVVGLAGLEVPEFFQGLDWSQVFAGQTASPVDRVTYYETHKGAVGPHEGAEGLRRKGLLEVGVLQSGQKETYRVKNETREVFDLNTDGAEANDLVAAESPMSESLKQWLSQVRKGLELSDELPPPSLSDDDMEALRALGYLD